MRSEPTALSSALVVLKDAGVNPVAARAIADVLLSDTWNRESAAQRLEGILAGHGSRWAWPRRLVDYLFDLAEFHSVPRRDLLISLLSNDEKIESLTRSSQRRLLKWALQFRRTDLPSATMTPSQAAVNWNVPDICTTGQLCEALELSDGRLHWLADRRLIEHRQWKEKLRNYRYFRLSKRSGGSRLIEAPKQELKRVQRRIADNILQQIPVHEACHSFIVRRSPVTAAGLHVRRDVVLRIDVQEFFPSITAGRVAGVFRTAGYSPQVTSLLTGLCTNRTWRGAVDPDVDPCQHLFQAHLPQGSPASPLLANLCAWSLDRRLSALAGKFDAAYTRYADDLVFSGSHALTGRLSRFRIQILSILHNEGFETRRRKTQVMHRSQRQQVMGVVVNDHLNIGRDETDRLKAILTNSLRQGLDSQNREHHPDFAAHLRGRIAWVQAVNPQRGERLLKLWSDVMNAELSR